MRAPAWTRGGRPAGRAAEIFRISRRGDLSKPDPVCYTTPCAKNAKKEGRSESIWEPSGLTIRSISPHSPSRLKSGFTSSAASCIWSSAASCLTTITPPGYCRGLSRTARSGCCSSSRTMWRLSLPSMPGTLKRTRCGAIWGLPMMRTSSVLSTFSGTWGFMWAPWC